MKRATCATVGHSRMPGAQTRWLVAAFEVPRLANLDAANMTCFTRRSLSISQLSIMAQQFALTGSKVLKRFVAGSGFVEGL